MSTRNPVDDTRSGLVVRGCDVLDVPETGTCRVVPRRDIVVRDGVIEDIRASADVTTDASANVVDGRGLLAMPGLVNAHTHSAMVLMRGAAEDVPVDAWFNERVWPMESNLTAEDVRLGAELACAEMIRSGVTAFADHYFFPEQIADAALATGLRADIAPTYFSSRGPAALDAVVGFVEQWTTTGPGSRVTASLGPHAPYTVSDADLTVIADHARSMGARVHIHASEHREQTESSLERRGATPIEVLDRTGILDAGALIAHGCGIVEQDLPLLARHRGRTAVACCPKVYLKHALHPLTPIRQLRAAGVAVGVGTDGAAGHNTLDVWEALRLVAMTQKQQERDATWMPVSDALRLATRGGAEALGLGDELGALEPGRRADIVLVDLGGLHCRPLHDPLAALVYSVRASDVRTVIVDGRVLLRDGRLLTIDVDGLLAEVDSRATRLLDTSHGLAVQHYDP